eukprot:7681484-Alexandrium_andersonii.AAC.1
MCIRDRARWEEPGRRLQFIKLHWEDGRPSRAPLLDGLSWGMLRPDGGSSGRGSVTTGAGSPKAGAKAGKR